MGEELKQSGLDGEIDMEGLNASDFAGRARTFKQMIEAGMGLADAHRLTGLLQFASEVSL